MILPKSSPLPSSSLLSASTGALAGRTRSLFVAAMQSNDPGALDWDIVFISRGMPLTTGQPRVTG